MQIIDRIVEKIQKDSISILKLSKEADIPAYRIYKWVDKKANPKHEDIIKLEKWLSGNVELIPNGNDNSDAFDVSNDYKEKYIKLLEDKCNNLEKEVGINLGKVLSNQKLMIRQIAVASRLAAAHYAGNDKEKFQDELDKIDTLVNAVQ